MNGQKKESFSEEINRLMRESDERVRNMTIDEREALQKARKRHARRARVEMQGYDKHPDEKYKNN